MIVYKKICDSLAAELNDKFHFMERYYFYVVDPFTIMCDEFSYGRNRALLNIVFDCSIIRVEKIKDFLYPKMIGIIELDNPLCFDKLYEILRNEFNGFDPRTS